MTYKVGLRINGVGREIDYAVGKSAVDYANEFKAAFATLFPSFTFSVSTGGNLSVVAPEGVALVITAYGDRMAFTPQVSVRSGKEKVAPPVVVVISSGTAKQVYRISLDGTPFTCLTGGTDEPSSWHADNVAEAFRALLATNGYVVQRFSNILTIRKANGAPISFGVSDSFNNESIKAYQGSVPTEADLPAWMDETTVLAIGDTKDGGYYVKFTYRDAVTGEEKSPTVVTHPAFTDVLGQPQPGWSVIEGTSSGVYEETYLTGVRTAFNPETMPHILVRESDGTFTFKAAKWGKRTVGDELSVPPPSFEGKAIKDLFFFRNRLGLLTDETLVFSRSGKFFDFWPETAKDVLETDPIDVMVSTERVSQLHYAVPFNTSTLLFGENSQFIVTAQGTLTPRSIAVQPTTNFEMSKAVRPLAIGPSVYFVADKDKFSSVWEYYVQEGTYANTAQDVSQHVPRFIPSGVYQLVGSASENMVIGLSSADRKKLCVYQYLWAGNQKIQSAWGYWTFAGEVINAAFMGSQLYLVMKHAGEGIYLERIDLQEPLGTALVDRKGHALWKQYEMVYEFSPQFLSTQQGNMIGGKRKLKTLNVSHNGLGWLHVGVLPKGRDIVWRTYPDAARDTAFQGDREGDTLSAGLIGDAADTRVFLLNNSNAQTIINSVEFELTNDIRSRRI